MARFAYTARDRAGKTVSADLEAPSRRDALRIIAERGLQVASVAELAGGTAGKPATPKPEKATSADRAARARGPQAPRRTECLPFLEALHDLLGSGLSAGEAVRLLSVRVKEPRLRTLCVALWKQIS